MPDGRPYAPIRYNQIVQEAYVITKNSGIPYGDILKMTPTERKSVLEFISDEVEKAQQELEKRKAENAARK